MNIIDVLLGEHGALYAQFDSLESTLVSGDDVNVVHALARTFTVAIETHAHIEDELLFGELERALGGPFPPVIVMRREHEEIEDALHRACTVADAHAAAEALRDAIEVARSHFQKEERVLFPAAEQRLNRGTLAALGEQWAQRRGITTIEIPARG